MKFKILEGKAKEPEVELFLEHSVASGTVNLVCREATGKEQYLMTFMSGKFVRSMGVSVEGIETNTRGQIKELVSQ